MPEPFELPSEEEWAALRLAEAGEREARRKRLATLPVHAKSTLASRMQAVVDPEAGAPSLRAILHGAAGDDGGAAAGGGAAGTIPAAHPAELYVRRTGDGVQDMLAKKRQIFLLQVGERVTYTRATKGGRDVQETAGGCSLRKGWSPRLPPQVCMLLSLLQMSLDNKRGEIAKLEQRAKQREEALQVRKAVEGGSCSGRWLVAGSASSH